jgi:hypothetical protein
MLTVIENAYYRKISIHPNHSETHKKVLFALLHEKKYFAKDELLCFANYDEKMLDRTILDLEDVGLIKTEGWLVKINEIHFEEEAEKLLA